MRTLAPWAHGPFELLFHAEMHLRDGDDFDRRIAFIGFDNAIEVAIATYLTLNPLQRQNRTYTKADCERWLNNYHTKIDFLENECGRRGVAMACTKGEFVWYHEIRNGQYHAGGATVPQERDLEGLRKAAVWVFSVLFDVPDVDDLLAERLTEATTSDLPKRDGEYDKLIDSQFGMVQIAGQKFYTSEVLHGVDPIAYVTIAKELQDSDSGSSESK